MGPVFGVPQSDRVLMQSKIVHAATIYVFDKYTPNLAVQGDMGWVQLK